MQANQNQSAVHPLLRLLSYPRSVLIGLFIPVWTLVCALLLIVFSFIPGTRPLLNFIASNVWSRTFLKISGLDIEVRGRENFPDQGGLFLFNHTSNFDIFILFGTFPEKAIKFGAKGELFKIPILSMAMRRLGILPIERKNRKKVLQVYKSAEQRMKAGENFALAPEGTRMKDYALGSFRNGPFLFAVGAQSPIIPVVIAGALPIMPPRSILVNPGVWKRKVIIQILPYVNTKGYTEDNVRQVRDQVREVMLEKYTALKNELGLPQQ